MSSFYQWYNWARIDILEKYIQTNTSKMELVDNYIFLQDNDPEQNVFITRRWVDDYYQIFDIWSFHKQQFFILFLFS